MTRVHVFALFCGVALCLPAGCAEDSCADSGTCFEATPNTGGGTGDGGSGGAGGEEPECIAGTVRSCYDGPVGTKGVGICASGTQSCTSDGRWESCVGAVWPAEESCSTPADEDCDGTADEVDAGCVCAPAATMPCYDGPTGTLGVGLCAEGVATCNASGLAWDACQGAVLPSAESCQNVTDDDCDGKTCAAPLWAKSFSSSDDDQLVAMDADATSVVLVGHSTGTLDFGAGPLPGAGLEDALIVKVDLNGNLLWATRLGGAAAEKARAVDIDSLGNVVVVGEFGAQLDVQGTTLTASGNINSFVIKLNSAGVLQWAKALGYEGDTHATGVSVDSFGRVLVAGTFDGKLVCGGVPVPFCHQTKGLEDAFVAAYNGGGAELWKATIGDAAVQTCTALVVDPNGTVYVAGKTSGAIDFGNGIAGSPPPGVTSFWLAKLNATGDGLWVSVPGTLGSSEAQALTIGASGEVYAVGDLNGTLDFGALGQATSVGLSDTFLAVFSGVGAAQDIRTYGAAGQVTSPLAVARAGGGLAITGATTGDVDFGGGVLPGVSPLGADAFLLVLDNARAHHWSRIYGGMGVVAGRGVAPSPDGGLFVTATVDGDVDMGLGPLVGTGGNDIVVARFGP